jgi:hypothetical protein
MAIPMRSTDFRSIVEPILNEEFDGIYDQRKDEWKGVFKEVRGIPRSYHERPYLYGFTMAPEMPDGDPVSYDAGGQLYVARAFYRVWGLGFAITKVLVEDGDHIDIGRTYARHLAQSLIETKETLAANVLNFAFNGSYPGGDGVSLCSTSHPLVNGTFSNQLATPAALSQTSLEQILIQVRQAVDARGKKINLQPRSIVCSPANVFQAEVLLKTPLRTSTANNDINPVISSGLLPEGQHNMSRLTSNTAWWVSTNVPDDAGLQIVMRRGLEKSMEGDFETDSMRFKSTERYVPFWVDPRTVYGTSGL